jgi:hypothetical protein
MSPREIIDWTLRESGYGDLATLEKERWLDLQPPFRESHFLDGFAFPDGKFRFKADWTDTPVANDGLRGPWRAMPNLPDYWPINEDADEDHPFKLATSPARNFLNSKLQRDGDFAVARTATRSAHQSVRRGRAWDLAGRCCAAGQRARANTATRAHIRGREAGSPGQRRHLAAFRLS